MGLFKRLDVNGKKVSPTKVTELAIRAADSITLTGFSSTEELYSLLKVNCMGCDTVINEALKELANTYNERATRDSEKLYSVDNFAGLRDSYITNIVLMDDKLKMIADVRSFIAIQQISEKEMKKLPLNNIDPEDYVDASSVISSIAAAIPDHNNKLTIVNKSAKEV